MCRLLYKRVLYHVFSREERVEHKKGPATHHSRQEELILNRFSFTFLLVWAQPRGPLVSPAVRGVITTH